MRDILNWIAENQDAATGIGILLFFALLMICITVYNISNDWANRQSGCCCSCHDQEDDDADNSTGS